jgi:aminopeptidase N
MNTTLRYILVFLIPVLFSNHLNSQKNNFDCGKKGSVSTYPDWIRNAAENVRSDTIDLLHFDIHLNFRNITTQNISGYSRIHFTPKQNNINSISLDLLKFTVDSVVYKNGNNLSYQYNDTLLVVGLPTVLNTTDTTWIDVYYSGTPTQDPSGWGGFYFQGNYAYNLGVGFSVDPHTFGRAWHPCFDNFAERATYHFNILTRATDAAYCNGELQSKMTTGADSVLHVWHLNDNIPSYLASVAVSPYTHVSWKHVSAVTGDTIPVWLIAQPSDTNNMKTSFQNIGIAIDGFELRYGAHQWNKVGFVLVPFNAGAMEHATNIAYPRSTATGTLLYQTLMAHELSHHWWGDYVTTESASEMWINEGMARYSEAIFMEALQGTSGYKTNILANHFDVLRNAHLKDSGHYALNAIPHLYTYGDHSYNKGADMVHTLRGYLGDSLFFTGLKHIQNQFPRKNINSLEFRDALTTGTGKDMTDFFNDWILSPGQPHFSVDSFVVYGTGPYQIQVFVKQTLRARTNFAQNVPLQLSLMYPDWTVKDTTVVMSGPLFSFVIPSAQTPVSIMINRDDKISHAVTAQERIIQSTALSNLTQALMSLAPQTVVDSSFLRIEHHWVAPDGFINQPNNMIISRERYWRVEGIIASGTTINGRIDINGTTTSAGYLDNELLQDITGQTFTEDSIVMLYRPDRATNWSEYPTYTLNTQGSATNRIAQITIQNLQPGEYTLGYRTPSVGIDEFRKEYSENFLKLYPNPATETVYFDIDEEIDEVYIYDLTGKLVMLSIHKKQEIPITSLQQGEYILIIKDQHGNKYQGRFMISRPD